MTPAADPGGDIAELHRMAEMLRHLDAGLVVLDRDCRIQFWNAFMENHSGLRSHKVEGRSVFELFPEIQEDWFRHKVESVFLLNNRVFTIWEQRSYLFRFRHYRPITGTAEFMYQNTIVIPLVGLNGAVDQAAVIVYDVTDMATSKQAVTDANARLEFLSRTDRLTALNNRGHWEECVIREFQRFQRTGQKAALLMFDIDHFKKVNDCHGHPAGDAVIRATAQTLKRNLRGTDIGGRYGGEEFGAVLINTDAVGAYYFAERLRKSIQAQTVEHDGRSIACTISLGVCELTAEVSDYKQWIERADGALYRSKQNGRNRTTLFGAGES